MSEGHQSLAIHCSNGEIITVQVADSKETLFDIIAVVKDSPKTGHLTCFHLALPDGTALASYTELGSLPKGTTELHMVHDSYDIREARAHVARFRSMLTTTPLHYNSPIPQERDMDIAQLEKPTTSLRMLAKEGTKDPPVCVGGIVFSAFNPVPGHRRVRGDLAYLAIETLEGEKLHVTITRDGFFINSSTDTKFNPSPRSQNPCSSRTLLGLLEVASPGFSSCFTELLSRETDVHPFETLSAPGGSATAWCTTVEDHKADWNRAEASSCDMYGVVDVGAVRSWNDEFQGARSLAKETTDEILMRDRLMYKIATDFVSAAIAGSRAVAEGSIPPINPAEIKGLDVWVYNGIFFSLVNDRRGLLATSGGYDGAYKFAGVDLRAVKMVNDSGVDEIHPLLTCLVDYAGERYVCQGVIPGILFGDQTSTVLYGHVDEGPAVKPDTVFIEHFRRVAKALRIAQRDTVDLCGNLIDTACFGMETKGIMGSDRLHYVLDLFRPTPRDTNFEGDHYILRPELIAAFSEQAAVDVIKSNPIENETEEETRARFTSVANNLEFNVNAFTRFECIDDPLLADDKALVSEAGKYLLQVAVPRVVKELSNLTTLAIDGDSLAEVFHTHGVNMRYLGRVAMVCAHAPFLRDVCLRSIVSRTAKHVLKAILRRFMDSSSPLASIVATFLSSLLGQYAFGQGITAEQLSEATKMLEDDEVEMEAQRIAELEYFDSISQGVPASRPIFTPRNVEDFTSPPAVWAAIVRQAKSRFMYDIALLHEIADPFFKLNVLREVCKTVGVQVAMKDYDFSLPAPFNVTDVLDIFPVVKKVLPLSPDVSEYLRIARLFMRNGQLDDAYAFLMQVMQVLHTVVGPIHPETARCYAALASIHHHFGQNDQAVDIQQRALAVLSNLFGGDTAEAALYHSKFANYLQTCGNFSLAVVHQKKSINLSNVLCGPNHSFSAAQLYNLAIIYQRAGENQLALDVLEQCLSRYAACLGTSHFHTGHVHHYMALICASMGNFRAAVQHEKVTRDTITALLEPTHPFVVNSKAMLSTFTMNAVKAQSGKAVDPTPIDSGVSWMDFSTRSLPMIPRTVSTKPTPATKEEATAPAVKEATLEMPGQGDLEDDFVMVSAPEPEKTKDPKGKKVRKKQNKKKKSGARS